MPQRRTDLRRMATIGSAVAAVVLGFAVVSSVTAASESGSPTALDTAFDWQPVPGLAVDLSIDADGEAYATDADGHVWHWRPDGQRWGPMSGRFSRIVGAGGNRPWAIDAEGRIFRYNGLWWEKKGEGGADIAADTKGDVLVAGTTGGLRRWNALRGEWTPIAGNVDSVRVALAPDGTAWTLDRQGRVRHADGTDWVGPLGDIQARDLAADSKQHGWVVGRDGRLLAWQPESRRWRVIPLPKERAALNVAVAPDGKPWVVLQGGDMVAATRLGPPPDDGKAEKPVASVPHADIPHAAPIRAPEAHAVQSAAPPATAAVPVAPPVVTAEVPPPRPARVATRSYIDPATVTATGPLTFTDTRATAERIAIGRDGSIFALAPDSGDVARWSNARQRLESFPGQLARLAVDPDGHPWGISTLGRIFRHDGTRWAQVRGTASDIGIGADGTVIVADNTGVLYRLNAAGSAFGRIPGSGILVAVDPDGHPWTVGADGDVRRCAASPCTRLGRKAISIAVGPDRSVYVVSDANVLMRYDAANARFERVTIPGRAPKQVAVGPSGYPWVVTTDNALLSSHMFARDEARDTLVARRTGGDTTGSGATETVTSTSSLSGFIFTKNIRFETVDTDVLSPGDWAHLDAGNDGAFYAYNNGGYLTKYSAAKKKFENKSSALGDGSNDATDFAVASNGDIWAYTLNPTTGLFRERNRTLTQYTVSGLMVSAVALAPDDTVYAVFYTGSSYWLYRKRPSDPKFVKFSNDTNIHDVAVGPGNDVWIVDKSNYVREWTGAEFEKRPAAGQKASRIDVGSDGTVYIVDTDSGVRKWNGANQSFDKINNVTAGYVAVDDDGRPWISVNSTPTVKRARD